MTARAILLESTRVDVSDAERHGRLFELFDREHPRPPVWLPEQVVAALEARLNAIGYDPKRDMIVVSGSTVLLTVVLAWLGSRYGQFDALVFDVRDRVYRRLTLGGHHATV